MSCVTLGPSSDNVCIVNGNVLHVYVVKVQHFDTHRRAITAAGYGLALENLGQHVATALKEASQLKCSVSFSEASLVKAEAAWA
jgi:hypothetical protein